MYSEQQKGLNDLILSLSSFFVIVNDADTLALTSTYNKRHVLRDFQDFL